MADENPKQDPAPPPAAESRTALSANGVRWIQASENAPPERRSENGANPLSAAPAGQVPNQIPINRPMSSPAPPPKKSSS